MLEWVKYRGEKDLFGVDFGPRLGSGETLNATPAPTARIVRKATGADASADFGPIGVADSPFARITLQAATGTAQATGAYIVYVTAQTSGGRTVKQHAHFYVIDER